MKTRTKLKDLTRDNQPSPREELNEAELDLVTGGLPMCTCPNTSSPCGPDDN